MEQRSYEWYEARKGLFTASQIYRLMGARGLGQTGETYIIERVTEAFGVSLQEIDNYAMQWGRDMEPQAKLYYQAAFNCEIEEDGFIIAEWNEQAGCSPDGLLPKQKKGIEIKCPINPAIHTKNLMIRTGEDLKKIHPQYYWQIQMSMAIFNYKKWDFVSFHPEFTGSNRMIAIEIEVNEKDIELLKSRIEEAVKIKEEYLKKIAD